jgi:hypothetical protein
MVICRMCKKKFNWINWKHLKYSHNITIKEYKQLYPLIETISLKIRNKIIKNNKGKHSALKSNETRKRMSIAQKAIYTSGKKQLPFGNLNPFYGKHHTKECIKKFTKSRIENGTWLKNIRKSNSKPRTEADKKRLSIIVSTMLANGEISSGRNCHKKGWYKSLISGIKEYYESSYELERMKQLDALNIPWTKKHHIRIEYINENKRYSNYVPDFLVNNKIIEEVKPKPLINTKNNLLKFEAARKFCEENGYKFKILTEKELHIQC